jgi:hypothetical protein
VARASSSGGITPAHLREMITMVVKAARDAGQYDCVTHLLQARDALTCEPLETDTSRRASARR